MTKDFRISWSKISLYQQCPFKYKKVNIDKIYEPETIFMWNGKVLHACIEKLSNQYLMQNIEFLDAFLEKFEFNFMKKNFQNALQKRMLKEGFDILTQIYFLATECDLFKFLKKTEWYFRIPFEDVTITGIIDRLDTYENCCNITDYKSGREHPFEYYKEQLKLYQWATQQSYDYNIETINIHLLTNQKILSHKKFSDNEIEKLLTEVSEIIENIKNEKFEPKQNDWCKYCIFKDDCGI